MARHTTLGSRVRARNVGCHIATACSRWRAAPRISPRLKSVVPRAPWAMTVQNGSEMHSRGDEVLGDLACVTQVRAGYVEDVKGALRLEPRPRKVEPVGKLKSQ